MAAGKRDSVAGLGVGGEPGLPVEYPGDWADHIGRPSLQTPESGRPSSTETPGEWAEKAGRPAMQTRDERKNEKLEM